MMKTLRSFVLLGAVTAAATVGRAQAPHVGDPAPGFSLKYATKDSIASLPITLAAAISSGPVVLAFYPADWSTGCTKEVCTLRDEFASIAKLNATILAISGDYTWSHHEWAKHHELPFRLLSDHDHAVARAYASYNPETGFNRRTVFVVDTNGRIAYADLEYSVKDDADLHRLQEALAAIPASPAVQPAVR